VERGEKTNTKKQETKQTNNNKKPFQVQEQ
jgi:hypothetical protein